MTTYTAIPLDDINTDSPLTQSLMTLLRDNWIAGFEGAASAPRIVRGAITPGVGHRWFYDYGDGTDGAVTDSANRSAAPGLYQYTTYTLDATFTLDLSASGPLIIVAQTSITINGTIDVDGQGGRGGEATDEVGQHGVFGGSGGGGSAAAGGATFLNDGGAATIDGSAQSSTARDLLLSAPPVAGSGVLSQNEGNYALGGGGGGAISATDGLSGGGLLILVAPIITLGAAAIITADGLGGTSSAGGGGAIILATPTGKLTETAGSSVAASAGIGTAGATDGGAGWVERLVLT